MEINKEQKNFIKAIGLLEGDTLINATTIREVFPTLFEPIEGWYKSKSILNKKWLCYFDGVKYLYGIDSWGDWVISDGVHTPDDINDYLITDEEAEASLTLLAKDLGLTKKGYIKSASSNIVAKIVESETTDITLIHGSLIMSHEYGQIIIFNNGKWATTVDVISKEEAEKELGKIIED